MGRTFPTESARRRAAPARPPSPTRWGETPPGFPPPRRRHPEAAAELERGPLAPREGPRLPRRPGYHQIDAALDSPMLGHLEACLLRIDGAGLPSTRRPVADQSANRHPLIFQEKTQHRRPEGPLHGRGARRWEPSNETPPGAPIGWRRPRDIDRAPQRRPWGALGRWGAILARGSARRTRGSRAAPLWCTAYRTRTTPSTSSSPAPAEGAAVLMVRACSPARASGAGQTPAEGAAGPPCNAEPRLACGVRARTTPAGANSLRRSERCSDSALCRRRSGSRSLRPRRSGPWVTSNARSYPAELAAARFAPIRARNCHF